MKEFVYLEEFYKISEIISSIERFFVIEQIFFTERILLLETPCHWMPSVSLLLPVLVSVLMCVADVGVVFAEPELNVIGQFKK